MSLTGALARAPLAPGLWNLDGGDSPAARAARWGLVSDWNLSDLTDSYGANTLSNNGVATFNTGKLGNAVYLASASSQFLSRTDNASLSIGDTDCWWDGWAYLASKTADMTILGKCDIGVQLEYLLRYIQSSDRFTIFASPNGSTGTTVIANTFGSPSTATFLYWMVYHDKVNDLLGLSINGGTFDTGAIVGGIFDGPSRFSIGSVDNVGVGSRFWDGRLDEIGFGKSPPGGIAALATQIRDYRYNGGAGRAFPQDWT